MNQFETFQGILGALRAAPRDRQGRLLSNADYTLKVLVSVVGELAAISTNFENSAADRESLAKVLGAISCCNIALHDCYQINCAEAIATFLSDPTARKTNALTVQTARTGGSEPDNGLLSPRTVSNFFPELDRYRFKAREDYNNELSWFVLADNGEVIDLKPNGRNIPVMYDELQYYLTLADLHRTKPLMQTPIADPVGRIAPPPTVVNSESTPTQRITKTLQVKAPGYNGDQVAALFSPTHFDNGLFAPLNTQTSLQVTYERPTSDSPPARGGNTNNANTMGGGVSQAHAAQAEVEKFWSLIAKIESHEITPEAVSSYNLTFSVPTADGSITELITGGSKICVNQHNLQSFLNIVKEKMTSPTNARVMRTGSIRPMVVNHIPYNPIVDEGKFSPSHFSRDLFAPFTSNTAVNVDLNNQDLVPTFLRNGGGSQPQAYAPPASATMQPPQQQQVVQQQQQQKPQPGASSTNLASALRNFSTNRKPAVPSFVDRIRDSDDEFVAILSQLDNDHEKVTEFGVTYCIPAACVNKAAVAANLLVDGIYDLIPNGRNIPVPPSNVPQYFQMIESVAS